MLACPRATWRSTNLAIRQQRDRKVRLRAKGRSPGAIGPRCRPGCRTAISVVSVARFSAVYYKLTRREVMTEPDVNARRVNVGCSATHRQASDKSHSVNLS